VNFLLPPHEFREGWGGVKNLRLLQGLIYQQCTGLIGRCWFYEGGIGIVTKCLEGLSNWRGRVRKSLWAVAVEETGGTVKSAFYRYKVRIHVLDDRTIAKYFPFHHPTPVAARVANWQKNRFIFPPGPFSGFVAPGRKVDRIFGVFSLWLAKLVILCPVDRSDTVVVLTINYAD